MLRPVVRFFLKSNCRFQEFVETAKQVFTEIAVEELEKTGKNVNLSRLCLATGLYRQELARIYKGQGKPLDETPSILTRVINRWQVDAHYTRKDGEPRTLSCKGEGSEFYELVRAVDRHASPGGILFELKRTGNAIETRRGVRLLLGGQQHIDVDTGYKALARDMELLVQAVEENIFAPKERRNVHITTVYDNVFIDEIPQIRDWLMAESKALHARAREYLSRFDKDIVHNPGKPAGAKISLGTFSLTQESIAGKDTEEKAEQRLGNS